MMPGAESISTVIVAWTLNSALVDSSCHLVGT